MMSRLGPIIDCNFFGCIFNAISMVVFVCPTVFAIPEVQIQLESFL